MSSRLLDDMPATTSATRSATERAKQALLTENTMARRPSRDGRRRVSDVGLVLFLVLIRATGVSTTATAKGRMRAGLDVRAYSFFPVSFFPHFAVQESVVGFRAVLVSAFEPILM
jgi:hypothetical protein